MRIDLHAHSSVSDGTEPPDALVESASQAGLDVLALADHDTTAGWAQAQSAAARVGIEVVPAIEVSTTWHGADVHLLAFWPEATDPDLVDLLVAIRAGRSARVPQILAGLAAHGVDLSEDDVRRASGAAVSLGRPHVADALVDAGIVASRAEAFDAWLAEGRPGYVAKPAPALVRAIDVVARAGGASVLAHPWGRGSAAVLDEAALVRLAAVGLVGLEVDHVDHTDKQRAQLRALAVRLGLVVTGGSDYHGSGKAGVGLGMNTTNRTSFEQLRDRRGEPARPVTRR